MEKEKKERDFDIVLSWKNSQYCWAQWCYPPPSSFSITWALWCTFKFENLLFKRSEWGNGLTCAGIATRNPCCSRTIQAVGIMGKVIQERRKHSCGPEPGGLRNSLKSSKLMSRSILCSFSRLQVCLKRRTTYV